ncbi:hypothetical protein AGMMS49592_0360 [Endomicrobiia bacterium]|nr:hypothetical protein AGMMS49592_0360 [Endomicrobiia bacterium]
MSRFKFVGPVIGLNPDPPIVPIGAPDDRFINAPLVKLGTKEVDDHGEIYQYVTAGADLAQNSFVTISNIYVATNTANADAANTMATVPYEIANGQNGFVKLLPYKVFHA